MAMHRGSSFEQIFGRTGGVRETGYRLVSKGRYTGCPEPIYGGMTPQSICGVVERHAACQLSDIR